MATSDDTTELFLDEKLIASRIDFFATHHPNKIVASIPVDPDDPLKGFRDISARSFASAIDRTARWLDKDLAAAESALGRINVFAYDGPIDLRWLLYIVASIKTGRTIVLSHTHTAITNLSHLYGGCGCNTLLRASDFPQRSPAIEQMIASGFFEVNHDVPTLASLLDGDAGDGYKYAKTWEEDADRVLIYFQSSGTTGPPKPIGHTNRSLIYWLNMRVLARSDQRLQLSVPPGHRIHCAYHISHVSGCWWYLLSMTYWDTVTVFSPPHIAASLEVIIPVLKTGNIRATAYPPSLLAQVAKDSTTLALVRKLFSVSTGGMMLDKTSAATIYNTNEVRLQNNYGSTEMMIMPLVRLPQESWPYLQFHSSAGVSMRPFTKAVDVGMPNNTDTIYENVIVRDPFKFEQGWQPVFYLFPELEEYHSKDLFKRHATKSDQWIYYGRIDDTLTLANGSKVFVADMQRALQENPLIAGAMIGVEQNTLFAIVELHPEELSKFADRREEAVNAVWPAIQNANALCATGDCIDRKAVVLATPDRPFLRFGKLSVDRRGTYALYRDEIANFSRQF